MKIKSTLVLGVIGLVSSLTASATVLLTESFTYTNGGLVANSGGNWTNLSGTGTFLQVSGGEVSGIVHGSGSREDAVRIFTGTPLTTQGFASFEFTVTTAPTAVQDYFFTFTYEASNFRGRVFIAAPSSPDSSAFRIGISNVTTTAANIVFSSNLTINTTYSIVVRAGANGVINSALWVGTDATAFLPGAPTITATDVYGVETLSRVVIRQGGTVTTANSANFDSLLVGTGFSDVAPLPEPSAFAALAGVGALGLVGLRRRRRA
jgi:hypothetical protein